MLPSEQLDELLPRLRRFARASTGDVRLADDCVEDALKALIKTIQDSPDDPMDNIEYQLYHLVQSALERRAGNSFEKQAWRAMILVMVEGRSTIEAAHIMGIDQASVAKLVASGQASARRIIGKI